MGTNNPRETRHCKSAQCFGVASISASLLIASSFAEVVELPGLNTDSVGR